MGKTTLQRVVIFLIALILGLTVALLISEGANNISGGNDRYRIISPSQVVGAPYHIWDNEIEVLVERCSTFSFPVSVSFDTEWDYYPSLPASPEDNASVPGVNGWSEERIVVYPGGSACEDPRGETAFTVPVPLGDPEVDQSASATAESRGMWPGFWSMHSKLKVRECHEIANDPDATTPSGETCVKEGDEVLDQESWFSEIFELRAGQGQGQRNQEEQE